MYNFCLFNQLVTSVRNKPLMQNITQEIDQFSGVKHLKGTGWETVRSLYTEILVWRNGHLFFKKSSKLC